MKDDFPVGDFSIFQPFIFRGVVVVFFFFFFGGIGNVWPLFLRLRCVSSVEKNPGWLVDIGDEVHYPTIWGLFHKPI